MTRYVIIGAGAVGAGMGARLHQAGRDVILVARGEHLAALRADGLRLRTPEADVRLPVPVVGSPDEPELTDDDVLVLATKTHQAPDALIAWTDVPVRGGGTAGERLPILIALNGVVGEDLALRYFDRVIGVVVWMWTAYLVPGEVLIEGSPLSGVFHLGRFPAEVADAEDTRLLDAIKGDWDASGLATVLTDDVLPWKYQKLLTNLGNGFQALLGQQSGMDRLIDAAIAEGRAVLDAAGIAVTPDAVAEADRAAYHVHPIRGVSDFIGGSTWQSLTRATGNVETDYLSGEIVRIARQNGLAAPINHTVATLVRQAAARGGRPGDLTVDALAKQLGLAQ